MEYVMRIVSSERGIYLKFCSWNYGEIRAFSTLGPGETRMWARKYGGCGPQESGVQATEMGAWSFSPKKLSQVNARTIVIARNVEKWASLVQRTRRRCEQHEIDVVFVLLCFKHWPFSTYKKGWWSKLIPFFLETGGSPSSVGIGWTASEIIRASPRQVHDNELKQLKDEISAKNSQLKELKQAADWISGWFFFETSGDLSILRRVWDRFSGDFGVAFVCGPGSFEWVGSTWV